MDCNGLFFKGSKYIWVNMIDGRINEKIELRLLKKKSCKGCDKCNWIWDFIQEDLQNGMNLSEVDHGKVYKPNIITSKDWESGLTDVDYIEFKEVQG